MVKLLEVKKTIKRIFPQLKKYSFKIWQSNFSNVFYLQCYADNCFYGNIYKVNLNNNTLTN